MKPNETKQQFVIGRAKGKSYATIAAELDVSKTTLIEWSKDLAVNIANLKAVETEALLEEYKASKQHRIETLGKLLTTVRSELESRELTNVPTERLFAVLSRLSEQIKTEETAMMFKYNNTPELNRFITTWEG